MKANWIKVTEQKPSVNTFKPLWWSDGERVGMGHYQGNGAWQTGLVHSQITHWAKVEWPDPPESEDLKNADSVLLGEVE